MPDIILKLADQLEHFFAQQLRLAQSTVIRVVDCTEQRGQNLHDQFKDLGAVALVSQLASQVVILVDERELSLFDVEPASFVERNGCTGLAEVVDELGVLDERDGSIVALKLDRATVNRLEHFVLEDLDPDLGQSVALLQGERAEEDSGALASHHVAVIVLRVAELLYHVAFHVVGAAELTVDVLEGVTLKNVRPVQGHLLCEVPKRKNSIRLCLIELVVLPWEERVLVLAFEAAHSFDHIPGRQQAVVAELIVVDERDARIEVEESALPTDELVASHFVAMELQRGVRQFAIEVDDAGTVADGGMSDNLHVEVVCDQIVAHVS